MCTKGFFLADKTKFWLKKRIFLAKKFIFSDSIRYLLFKNVNFYGGLRSNFRTSCQFTLPPIKLVNVYKRVFFGGQNEILAEKTNFSGKKVYIFRLNKISALQKCKLLWGSTF